MMAESRERSSPLLIICGPTATGKTQLAIACAQRLQGEIVNADALQVYKHMDIGTDKPGPDERAAATFHLIDYVDPNENYSVARYQADALRVIAEIHARERLPILCGGSGLYIRAAAYQLDLPIAPCDSDLRQALQREAAAHGSQYLHLRLAAIDPQAAARIDPANLRRVIRALEVHALTGRPFSRYHHFSSLDQQRQPRYNLLAFGLTLDRQELYQRIERRIESMIARGLMQEVQALLDRGCHSGLTSMQALGYRHLAACLSGCCEMAEAINLLKRDTRRFAKRQLTWFRADKRMRWLDASRPLEGLAEEIGEACRAQLGKTKV